MDQIKAFRKGNRQMKKATRFLSMLLALSMVLGIISGTALAANNDNPFTDVSDSAWYSLL